MRNYQTIRRSFEFSCIMGNPILALNLIGTEMGKKSIRLLNGDGDEKALPEGCRPVAIPTPNPP
jgi:hypothetical protein